MKKASYPEPASPAKIPSVKDDPQKLPWQPPQTFLEKISNLELLNAGAFSKVYKGNIKGIAGPVAIKAVSAVPYHCKA
jgi:hypothetical protein